MQWNFVNTEEGVNYDSNENFDWFQHIIYHQNNWHALIINQWLNLGHMQLWMKTARKISNLWFYLDPYTNE